MAAGADSLTYLNELISPDHDLEFLFVVSILHRYAMRLAARVVEWAPGDLEFKSFPPTPRHGGHASARAKSPG
jgi:hypothetical protein